MDRVAAARCLPIAAVLIAGLVLQGCGGTTPSDALRTAADDPCGGAREDLKSSENYFYAAIGMGAVGGAAVGLATGSPIRALIGAAVGAAAGSVGGYYMFKSDNIKGQARLVSSIHADLANENYEIDSAGARFQKLAQCRLNAAVAAKAEFEAGRMSRDDAQARLTKARQAFADDAQFADAISGKIEERGGQFEYATREILKEDPAGQKTLEERRKAAQAVPPPAAAAEPEPPPPGAPPPLPTAAPVLSRLVAPAPLPPEDAAGLAQLTDTNRVKRRAFADQVRRTRATAESAFNIDARISRAPTPILAG